MNHPRIVVRTLLLLGLALRIGSANAVEPEATSASASFAGWSTNGPAVYGLRTLSIQIQPGPPVSYFPPPEDLPPEIRQAMLRFLKAANFTTIRQTENVFDHFLPESLNHSVWTNFITRTNGRSMVVWNVRTHPSDWPAHAPVAQWNTNSLIWGLKGLTALSPCWEIEGNQGQAPITALTRRHGYTRGHDIGPDGIAKTFAGKKVWFLTTQNTLVEATVRREIVRTKPASGRDYTILVFGSDLPDSIEPMRVVDPGLVFAISNSKYVISSGVPCPIFKTEQRGNVSADVPGFTLDTYKGGDSGSPNMLPLPGELVFWTGRSTSGASPEMQADMDELCRLEGLDPASYQLQWVDLSGYPAY